MIFLFGAVQFEERTGRWVPEATGAPWGGKEQGRMGDTREAPDIGHLLGDKDRLSLWSAF